MKKYLYFIFFLLPVICFAAGTGDIAGKVKDTKTQEPIEYVTVLIKGTGIATFSNDKGSFQLKKVPAGKYKIIVKKLGYATIEENIVVNDGKTTIKNYKLEEQALKGKTINVTANRAIKRETPVAFTNLKSEELKEKYTTEDMPMLLEGVPGVFSTSTGLGESDLSIRGFSSEQIQILINGIPVNDPESQIVYWSNWTGLSSNVKSVQVQRGAGSSLYGSGAFGGSVNIETMGTGNETETTLRVSAGTYLSDDAADGKGGMEDYQPVNYNVLLNQKVFLKKQKVGISAMMERKGGDSYINGTNYDGYSFGMDVDVDTKKHDVKFSFIGAPQKHNQARKVQDLELMKKLGRQYNRNNNEEQENYYFKPQFSIRDDWEINESTSMLTNIFFTTGEGGGKYLRNDRFDTETGEVMTMELTEERTSSAVGRHARWVYEHTGGENGGVILDGYDPETQTFNGESCGSASNMSTSNYVHSYTNDSHNNHIQIGLNTYLKNNFTYFSTFIGGEFRRWDAEHFAEVKDFRYYNPLAEDNLGIYTKGQRRYDYDTIVNNLSAFFRIKSNREISELFYDALRVENTQFRMPFFLSLDVQYASYTSEVSENPIHIFDYNTGAFLDDTFYQTKEMTETDSLGNITKKFTDDDYKKTYDFVSPKAGININVTEEANVMFSFATAYKEPRVMDWYHRTYGPDSGQKYETKNVLIDYGELEPEKTVTFEVGGGYGTKSITFDLNLYHTKYTNKIESVNDQTGGSVTINAGSAIHKGIELSSNVKHGPFSIGGSFTFSSNRWDEIDIEPAKNLSTLEESDKDKEAEIFGLPASEVVDKVVPFTPEIMANLNASYVIPIKAKESELKIGATCNYRDRYFGTYTNKREQIDPETGNATEVSSELPHYMTVDLSLMYNTKIKTKNVSIKLDLNNIFNRENIASASYSTDYGREDYLKEIETMYVVPAPEFNVFLTTEITF